MRRKKGYIFLLAAGLVAIDVPSPRKCVIDRCEGQVCVVETPEGTVEIPKKAHYTEGMSIKCPLWSVEPT